MHRDARRGHRNCRCQRDSYEHCRPRTRSRVVMTKDEVRQAAENDLLVFIRLLAPHLLLGKCHEELVDWWQSSTRSLNCLVLLPRGHMKSKLIANKTVW